MAEFIPVNHEGKVIGKVQKVEFDVESGMMYAYLEINDKETIDKIKLGKTND